MAHTRVLSQVFMRIFQSDRFVEAIVVYLSWNMSLAPTAHFYPRIQDTHGKFVRQPGCCACAYSSRL